MDESDTGNPVAETWSIDSPARLSEYLMRLSEQARDGMIPVENRSSVDLIEAAGDWVEGIEGFLAARGKDIADLSPWAAVAMAFSAGLIYE